MKGITKIIFFPVILILAGCGNPTSPDKKVSFEISEHILPGYSITSLTFDSEGAAWIGSFREGLIKYDGKATFYNAQNSNLPDSILIWDVTVDHNDHIWIGSDIGLIHFDEENFSVFNTTNSPLPEDIVWCIAVDQSNALWMASCRFRQGGLVRFDGKNWQVFTPENSKLPVNGIRDIVVDNRNTIWIALSEYVDSACLMKISDKEWKLYDKTDFGFTPYYWGKLAVDDCANLYATMDYSLSSYFDISRPNLIVYNGRNWIVLNPVDEKGQSLGYVGTVSVDNIGKVWTTLYDREGLNLAVFNGKNWIYNFADIPIGMTTEIEFDQSNRAWIGTGDGIYILN